MAGKLTALSVKAATKTVGDGDGLWLIVDPKTGSKKWTFRFRFGGVPKQMGLGSAEAVKLADVRNKAAEARRTVSQGINPIEDRRKNKAAAIAPKVATPTFSECAEAYIDAKQVEWRNPKHVAQWRMTLLGGKSRGNRKAVDYCRAIRALPVDKIDVAAVLTVLQPVWLKRPETASRLRGRIEAVLDYSKVSGHRSSENPARWKGNLIHMLPSQQKRERGNHAALPYNEMREFMSDLRQREGVAARALELTILTASRTSEILQAEWSEFDLDKKVWIIPASRMKAGKEHRIPLSARAVEIVTQMAEAQTGEHVFPGNKPGKPLSQMSMLMLLRRMGRSDLTAHGFRSSFRDFAGDETSFQREVIEGALAHSLKNKTEAAYRRSDALEKRRALMESWAQFCEPRAPGNVVQLGARK